MERKKYVQTSGTFTYRATTSRKRKLTFVFLTELWRVDIVFIELIKSIIRDL